jgi:hypothetical protein
VAPKRTTLEPESPPHCLRAATALFRYKKAHEFVEHLKAVRAGEAEEDWFSGKEMAAKERQIDDLQSEIERLRFLIPPAAGGAAVDGSYTPYRGSGGTPHDTPHRTELERENARLKDALRLVSESRRSDGAGVPPTGGAALSAGDLQALLLSMQALPLHTRTSLRTHPVPAHCARRI